MKKIALFLGCGMMGMALIAGAQTVSGGATGYGSTGYGSAGGGTVSPGNSAIAYPYPGPNPINTGFIQFNNLVVSSVSSQNVPAEILADNQYAIETMGATGVDNAVPQKSTAPPQARMCYQFETQNSDTGNAIPCPVPPSTTTPSAVSAPNTTGIRVTASSTSTLYPAPTPPSFYYNPYRIEISATTQLSLRDRTPATLSNISVGDQINVFGYYNTDGSIQAFLVRDLSKPLQTQTIQLDNVKLVSISGTSLPATLAVTQGQVYPCYYFNGDTKQSYACPMGLPSFSTSAAAPMMKNMTDLQSPDYAMLRKYVVTIDAQTIVLDKNRTQLSLANLKIGDILNVYGETADNGQTLTADIVRDLSLPASASSYSGLVTQVNADGSFVIRTDDGQLITAQNAIQVGQKVTLTGLLDQAKNILSQISQLYINSGNTIEPTPIPYPYPLPSPPQPMPMMKTAPSAPTQ